MLLFDGVCNLCSRVVTFVLEHESGSELRFASLQSAVGRGLLSAHGRAADTGDPSTVILVEGGAIYERSDAALRAARYLRAPYRWLWWTRFVPRLVRDACYDFVARHRYGWFGKSDVCMIPSPGVRQRFLDQA